MCLCFWDGNSLMCRKAMAWVCRRHGPESRAYHQSISNLIYIYVSYVMWFQAANSLEASPNCECDSRPAPQEPRAKTVPMTGPDFEFATDR